MSIVVSFERIILLNTTFVSFFFLTGLFMFVNFTNESLRVMLNNWDTIRCTSSECAYVSLCECVSVCVLAVICVSMCLCVWAWGDPAATSLYQPKRNPQNTNSCKQCVRKGTAPTRLIIFNFHLRVCAMWGRDAKFIYTYHQYVFSPPISPASPLFYFEIYLPVKGV